MRIFADGNFVTFATRFPYLPFEGSLPPVAAEASLPGLCSRGPVAAVHVFV